MLDKIESTVTEKRRNDLLLHKGQIKQTLEADILSRYFLEKGYVEAGFKYDDEIEKSLTLFKDRMAYNKILVKG